MKFSHLAAMACAVLLCVLIAGCGDVFRPVATPLPQPSADPQTSRIAVFTSCQYIAGACSSSGVVGTASDVDVSGDSLDAVVPVGRSPKFALVEGSTIVAIFTADFDNDTVTEHTDSHLTPAAAPSVSTATTIGLPPGAQPISLVNANGTAYVAEFGRNVVGVLGGSPLALTSEIAVGAQPVNLTVLPNGKEIYAVNRGDNTVTVISTANTTPIATIAVGSTPVWAVPSADSLRVYVVNQGSGTVSVIDATSHTITKTLTVGTSPNYAVFDTHNLRVLVTNPGSNSLSVIAADSTAPASTFLTVTSVAVGTAPSSVTALADGTRVYVANTGSHSVSVINSLSLTVTKTISLITSADPTPSPVWISSDDESAKVLTANRDSGDVSVINTSTDTEVTDSTTGLPHRVLAPQIDPSCVPTTPNSCPRLNPVFIAVSAG